MHSKIAFLFLLCIFTVSAATFEYDDNCSKYHNDINTSIRSISECISINSPNSEQQCVNICGAAINSIKCDNSTLDTRPQIHNITSSCQQLLSNIEKQNSENETIEGLTLRLSNLEVRLVYLCGYCSNPDIGCKNESVEPVQVLYRSLLKSKTELFLARSENKSIQSEKCGEARNAFNVSAELISEYGRYTCFKKDMQDPLYRDALVYNLQQAQYCIDVCGNSTDDFRYISKECLIGKAERLDGIWYAKNLSTEHIDAIKQTASALENAEEHNKAAEKYEQLGYIFFQQSVDKINKMPDWEKIASIFDASTPVYMDYWASASREYELGGNNTRSKTMLVEYFNQQKNLARLKIFASIWLSALALFAISYIVPELLLILLKLLGWGSSFFNKWNPIRKIRPYFGKAIDAINEMKTERIVSWSKANFTIILEVLIGIWVGLAFFTSDYLRLTDATLSLMNVDFGGGIYAVNLSKEIFTNTAYYIFFQLLAVILLLLLVLKIAQSFIEDESQIRRAFFQSGKFGTEWFAVIIFDIVFNLWFAFICSLILTFALVTWTNLLL